MEEASRRSCKTQAEALANTANVGNDQRIAQKDIEV